MEDGNKASDDKITSFNSALKQFESLRLAAFDTFDASGKSYKGIAAGKSEDAKEKSQEIEKATKGAIAESKSTLVDIKKLIEESFMK